MLWLLVILALTFAFLNGYRDASSILAGVIASKAVPPRLALLVTAAAEFAAPFLFGVAVAKSLTVGIINQDVVSTGTVVTALATALAWTIFTWVRGIPSSSSHALVGGLIGAALFLNGRQAILASGLWKVILPIFLAPVAGMGAGYLVMHVILLLTANATPRANTRFQRLQIVTLIGLALAHSANDAQKSMGMITLGLLLEGRISEFKIPWIVIALCAGSIAAGASRGDWRLMRTLGRKIYAIRPINAFTSQAASAGVILVSSVLGAPVSTSQVISMALLGAGAAERVNKVRWKVGYDMILTWVVTIPATILIAGGLVEVFKGMEALIWLMSQG